jgi:hypothetical protein
MKNKFPFLLLLAGSLFLNTACHKCVECTELNPAGAEEIKYPEICGKKKDIYDYRNYMENNVNPKNKVKCKERKTTLF